MRRWRSEEDEDAASSCMFVVVFDSPTHPCSCFATYPDYDTLDYVFEQCDEIQVRRERHGTRDLEAKDKVHTPLHASIQ
jgi:hypothetical protein